jgi:hypothetical protein
MAELFSRRMFLSGGSALGMATVWGALSSGSADGMVAPIQRVGGPRLKLSLNAYSFGKLLNDHALGRGKGMSLFELAEFCARHDFDGLDPTGYYFPGYRSHRVPDDKLVYDLKRRIFELGLGISGTGVGNNFTVADSAARAKDVDWIKQWIEVAAKLGAPVLRVFADTQMRAQTWETASGGAKRSDVEEWIARGRHPGMRRPCGKIWHSDWRAEPRRFRQDRGGPHQPHPARRFPMVRSHRGYGLL